MPTLEHLLQELELLGLKPRDVRIMGETYDSIVAKAEESSEKEEE